MRGGNRGEFAPIVATEGSDLPRKAANTVAESACSQTEMNEFFRVAVA